jgi:pimeloyl-ACP methyl ester carboxylesterase
LTNEKQDFELRKVKANGIDINVATWGDGPPILLLHGWPHTWQVWQDVMPLLSTTHKVIAPDLRGLGKTTKAENGYDLHTLADDAAALLKALEIEQVCDVVGLDLGVQVAWMTSMRYPMMIRKLVVMEGLLGNLAGAERFLANGPPWWFRFHAVPDFAETVLEHNEAAYIDWFLKAGTKNGIGVRSDVRQAFINAYSNRDAMRCGFEHYRAFPRGAEQIEAIARDGKSTVPILAIAGGVVSDALSRQLQPISTKLTTAQIQDCAHIIPLEKPFDVAKCILQFLDVDAQ